MFQDNKNSRAAYLETKFTTTKMSDFSSVVAYYTRLQSLATQLANVGSPVTDQRLVMRLLVGLPTSYATYVTNMHQKDVLPFFRLCARGLNLKRPPRKNGPVILVPRLFLWMMIHPPHRSFAHLLVIIGPPITEAKRANKILTPVGNPPPTAAGSNPTTPPRLFRRPLGSFLSGRGGSSLHGPSHRAPTLLPRGSSVLHAPTAQVYLGQLHVVQPMHIPCKHLLLGIICSPPHNLNMLPRTLMQPCTPSLFNNRMIIGTWTRVLPLT